MGGFQQAVQGDRAAWTKPPVDIDVKVAFYYKNLILKRNFQMKSTGGFVQTAWSPCSSVVLQDFGNWEGV